MQTSGLVKEINGKSITVSMYKESACSHCDKCSDSAKILNQFTFNYTGEDVKVGDIITFQMEDNQVFKAALIVYIIPLIFMFLGYFIGAKLNLSEGKCIIISFTSLAVGFLGVFIYDKFVVKNKMEKSVKIVKIEKR
ncbi:MULTISPECIES: SoxR reducing system RseC family protein [Cetobacterium]|jgi:sigma-E factor negative regulatory protein RseC|uniref:SoxR reducing system RseC family protein n=1 Tax=Candidatus Cetobacterium colombiensis TaxID=3073100 RepID=A0ABU4W9M0_9FUSO|nr:SoxR reducing system RseC family protein [Candidatus Cetobacterium colombiensis]MDX8336228.1 SoxR reducing system RseC family protein [Candidatus Cetobacterium colombiensis]